EQLRQRLRVVGAAMRLREDELARLVARSARLEPLRLLLSAQDLDQPVVEVDGPHRRGALAARRHEVPAERRGELDDADPPAGQVDVRPSEPDQLADAHAGAEQERPQRVQTVALLAAQEGTGL